MNLNPIRANMTEVDLGNVRVLFSYKTAVAVFDRNLNRYIKTDKYWSRTTSRHINQWVDYHHDPVEWEIRPQSYFDALIGGVK